MTTTAEATPSQDQPIDDTSDVSEAQTNTEVSDNEAVTETGPGPTIGDTTGEDRLGADDTRTR